MTRPARLLLADFGRDYINHIKHEVRLSPRTVECYSCFLNHFMRWLEANGYSTPDLTAFNTPVLRRYLYAESGRGVRPRGIRSMFHPLRGLGDFLIANGVIETNPARAITLPKKDAANRPFVSTEELIAMLEAVERQSAPRQTALSRAMLCTLIYAGVRAQELLDLKVADVSLDAKTIFVQHGKGEKSRLLYMNDTLLSAMNEWMLARERDCTHDWLWAQDRGRRVGYGGLRKMLFDIRCMAGMRDHDNIQAHALRRAFASRLSKSVPIHLVSAAMGHSEVQTTLDYLQLETKQIEMMADASRITLPQKDSNVDSFNDRNSPPPTQKPLSAHKDWHRMRRSTPKLTR